MSTPVHSLTIIIEDDNDVNDDVEYNNDDICLTLYDSGFVSLYNSVWLCKDLDDCLTL